MKEHALTNVLGFYTLLGLERQIFMLVLECL